MSYKNFIKIRVYLAKLDHGFLKHLTTTFECMKKENALMLLTYLLTYFYFENININK